MWEGDCKRISNQWILIPFSSSSWIGPPHRFLRILLHQHTQSLAGHSRFSWRPPAVFALLLLGQLSSILFLLLLGVLLILTSELRYCLCPLSSTPAPSIFSFRTESSGLKEQVQISWRCFDIDLLVGSNLTFSKQPSPCTFVTQKEFFSYCI